MFRLVTVAVLTASSVFSGAQAQSREIELPILESREFTPRSLAISANALIASGGEEAVAELRRRLLPGADQAIPGSLVGLRVSWLCRLVFEPKPGKALRPPRFGALQLPYKTMPTAKWPEYPLAVEAGVPFVLAHLYLLGGLGEPPLEYLKYCAANGVVRGKRYTVPTREIALRALRELTVSERWNAISWVHRSATVNYAHDESQRIRFLTAQANRIGKSR